MLRNRVRATTRVVPAKSGLCRRWLCVSIVGATLVIARIVA
jgi:hypothetical protein